MGLTDYLLAAIVNLLLGLAIIVIIVIIVVVVNAALKEFIKLNDERKANNQKITDSKDDTP